MKTFLSIVVLFICQNLFCQEYHFDYYTVYEFKKNEKEKAINTKEIYYSNSKDTSYVFFVKINNGKMTDCFITDYKNQKTLFFTKSDSSMSDMTSFNFVTILDIDLKECRSIKNFEYQINYGSTKGSKTITIGRFKDKKLIEESFYITKPSTITQQQQYNFGILATPIWCEKFDLKNEEVIYNSYFMNKGRKKNIRNLLEINAISFDLKAS